MARRFFFNLDAEDPSQALVKSFIDDTQASPLVFARGDNFTANCYFLRVNPFPVPGRPFIYVNAPSTFKLAAGEIDATPTGGTFTLTGAAGGTTAAIAYNASAATVQTEVRAALTGFGAATVTGDAGGPWLIDRGATGAVSDITGTATALVPSGSTVVIVNAQDGNASVNEQWEVSLSRALPMLQTSWSATASATVNVTLVQSGSATANKVYSVSWNDDAYAGSVWLAVSTTGSNTQTVGPIPYNATASQVATVFAQHTAIATTDINVEQTAPCSFNVTFIGTLDLDNAPTVATASNTLSVPPGLTGTLAVSTYGANVILDGATSATVTFEAEARFAAGEPQTVCRLLNATFVADLISSTPGQTTGTEDYVTMSDLASGTITYVAEAGAVGTPSFTFVGDTDTGFYTGGAGQIDIANDGVRMLSLTTTGLSLIDSTARIRLIAGSAASPTLNFQRASADSDTGIYWVGADQMGFSAGGTLRATVDTSGMTIAGRLATDGFKAGIVSKTGTYTATTSDRTILCDASGGAFDIDLPTAASASGHILTIKKVDSSGNAVSIDPNGTELIDGSSTSVSLVSQWQAYTIHSDGTSWFVLNQY